MSWREILGVANSTETPSTHNSHNPQKTNRQHNNAYTANIAPGESKLLGALDSICKNLPIAAIEVYASLSQEDIHDWCTGKLSDNELVIFSNSLVQRKIMDQGKIPSHYTHRASCKQCGPIWLWMPGEVLECPWCWNKMAGKPIPRPSELQQHANLPNDFDKIRE